MKTILTSVLLLAFISTKTLGQPGMPAPDKSKMEAFKAWVGKWKGQGTVMQGPGSSSTSTVEETIEMKLDGLILVVEGIGKINAGSANEKVVHHAFGILSYDQKSGAYKFKTYLKDGRSADAWFEVTGTNTYRWGFDVPAGKIRYSIVLDPVAKQWNEVGEFSADGNAWNKFMEMKLTKAD